MFNKETPQKKKNAPINNTFGTFENVRSQTISMLLSKTIGHSPQVCVADPKQKVGLDMFTFFVQNFFVKKSLYF
jgi:hypothetical protein